MTTQVRDRYVTSETLLGFLDSAIDRAVEEVGLLSTSQTMRLHRLEVELLTRNTRYAALTEERLFRDRAEGDADTSLRVAVLSPDDSSLPAPPAWGEAIYHPREFEKQLEGTPFRATYFHDCRLWQIFDRRRNFGLQWMAGADAYPDWEPAAPLRVFLHWSYRAQGMRLAHAGTLGKNGKGVLFVGVGGSGKSGTVVGGIAHGLESVGDDYILIAHREDSAEAHPLFNTLKQDRKGLERLALAAKVTENRTVNWQNKFEFRSEEISGRPLVNSLDIRAIVIPRIADAPRSNIREIPRSRAMLALAPTGLFQMPGERDSGVRFFSDTVRHVPCFELALSRDPADVSQTIEKFIDGGFRCD